jgi:hypothetical protein
MDWTIAINRNRNALIAIIVALMKSLGLGDGGVLTNLLFYLDRKALLIIRPAEAAVRRLIMMVAYDMELRGVKPRTTLPTNKRHPFAFPNAANFAPSFNLIDPLKTFGGERPDYAAFGLEFCEEHGQSETHRVPAVGLGRRLIALKNALEGIHKQALRLTRWYTQRDAALQQNQAHRFSPMRPGLPPYNRKRPRHEVETVLCECHGLALYAFARRDSS